jgi:hypothetical protein
MADFVFFKPLFGGRLARLFSPFFSLLEKQPQEQPQTSFVLTDQVLPVHYFDDTQVNRHMVMSWTMLFDDILDPHALHYSLARLLEIGEWRKLGGRLRLNVSRHLMHNYAAMAAPDLSTE